MISKQIQNMTVLKENPPIDEDITMMDDQMPTNLSMDKSNEKSLKSPSSDSREPIPCVKSMDTSATTPGVNAPSETKIHLSFSVDRLLSNERTTTTNTPAPSESNDDCNKDAGRTPEKCCDNVYSCCMYPSCLVGSQHEIHQPHQQRQQLIQKNMPPGYLQADGMSKLYFPNAYADFKSVVRPTPIRALGNNCDTVSPLCAPFPAAFAAQPPLFRFHQQQQHHHHQQHQQHSGQAQKTHPAMTPIMMTSLTGLKSLQMHQQHAPRFPTHKTNGLHIDQMTASTAATTPSFAGLHYHQMQGFSNFPHNSSNSSTAPSAGSTNSSNNTSGNNGGNGVGAGGSGSSAAANNGKRKRSWSRAVFSNLQRKGLEIQFQQQKYITKPDRRKLAARLNLTDAQVKVWFQNRRMKWRHTRENLKSGQEKQVPSTGPNVPGDADVKDGKSVGDGERTDLIGYSTDGSSSVGDLSENDEDDDEIDVVE